MRVQARASCSRQAPSALDSFPPASIVQRRHRHRRPASASREQGGVAIVPPFKFTAYRAFAYMLIQHSDSRSPYNKTTTRLREQILIHLIRLSCMYALPRLESLFVRPTPYKKTRDRTIVMACRRRIVDRSWTDAQPSYDNPPKRKKKEKKTRTS